MVRRQFFSTLLPRRRFLRVLGASLAAFTLAVSAQPRPARPKLVLAIMVDQFRYDYLTRFGAEYTGGLKKLMAEGANFTNARYAHAATVTAVGHSTFLTGATPANSGIIGNEWYDVDSGATVTSVSDGRTRLVGGPGAGSSPRRLLTSTIGDELKILNKDTKVIGVSLKDRSAILPVGHAADAAYWFDVTSGNFVTSNYYVPALPGWVDEFNKARPADKYAGQEWMKHKNPPNAAPALYNELESTPGGNELIQQFALKALASEKLGTTAGRTDLLAVSYSSNDYVGHRYGPDSEEAHDMALRVDKQIGELISAAEAQAGAGNVVVVLSADHGVAPVPEENRRRKLPGGRADREFTQTALELVLQAKFGGTKWISYIGEAGVYLNEATAANAKVPMEQVEEVAASTLRQLPHVYRVYTKTQLMNGNFATDEVGTRVRNSFNQARSANVTVILEPYWIYSNATTGTTHGTPFDYDTHVPVIFWGAGIKGGRYNGAIAPNDIAPTLATLLDIQTPSGSAGRALADILK
jgi:hypothetical protein